MRADRLISADMKQFVERQLRRWEIGRAQHFEPGSAVLPVQPFVTISNAIGAGGREVAELLAGRLGWPLFDRNLLTAMAEQDEWRARMYHSLDERDMSWIEQTARFMLDQSFLRNDYFRRLTTTVLSLARECPTIFVGRFADLILPGDRGLRVKIAASLNARVASFAACSGTSAREAERCVRRIEHEREDFLLHHFPGSRGESGRFDLVINSERLDTQEAVELIVTAAELRGVAPQAGSHPRGRGVQPVSGDHSQERRVERWNT